MNDAKKHGKVAHAQRRAELEAACRDGRRFPEPYRITAALDTRGLYGPEVDKACGTAEPAVDLWEKGLAAPSWEQLVALAELTQMPVEFFFSATRKRERDIREHAGWVCGTGGCQSLETVEYPEPFSADMAPVIPLGRRR